VSDLFTCRDQNQLLFAWNDCSTGGSIIQFVDRVTTAAKKRVWTDISMMNDGVSVFAVETAGAPKL
jgi:hypothetical protein